MDESYDTAEDLLVRNRTLLEKLSKELIEVETVDANHLMRLIEEYAVDEIQVDGPSQTAIRTATGSRCTTLRNLAIQSGSGTVLWDPAPFSWASST